MSKPKPLWKPDDQTARLDELTAQSGDRAKDNALRRDIRSLGVLLGQVLVEQAGQGLFDEVEQLRRLLIQHRKQARSHPNSVASAGLASYAGTTSQTDWSYLDSVHPDQALASASAPPRRPRR